MNVAELDRVRRHSATSANQAIDDLFENTVFAYADASPRELSRRIDALEREWDVERLLETNASSLAFTGVVLAAVHDKRWLLLSGGVLAFLFLHGVQGWCPPLPVLRRFGIRTRGEIDRERFALKFLRGDFDDVRTARGQLDPAKLLVAMS